MSKTGVPKNKRQTSNEELLLRIENIYRQPCPFQKSKQIYRQFYQFQLMINQWDMACVVI